MREIRRKVNMELHYKLSKETKTCYVFSTGEPRTSEHQTLYLKKEQVKAAGIDAQKGIIVNIEEEK